MAEATDIEDGDIALVTGENIQHARRDNARLPTATLVTFRKLDGYSASIEYAATICADHTPAQEKTGLEEVRFLSGRATVTVTGKNLLPLRDALSLRQCCRVQESTHETPGRPWVRSITVEYLL